MGKNFKTLYKNITEQMSAKESLQNWEYDDSKKYAEKLIKFYGQPDDVSKERLTWNTLNSFGKGERETYIVDESIPHSFPKPHRDYVYTVMSVKIPNEMLDTLGHVTGSIIYDGLKEEVTARCGSLYANAATLGFVRDMVNGKVTTDFEGAKREYADRIQKKPLPDFYDNKLKEEFTLEVCNHTHSLWDEVKENAPSLAVLKKKIKSGQKLGSTETASAKARGLIKRSDGTKRKSDKNK